MTDLLVFFFSKLCILAAVEKCNKSSLLRSVPGAAEKQFCLTVKFQLHLYH